MHTYGTVIGIILVDHGSKLAEANDLLLDVVRLVQERVGAAIVEPAHMDIAGPTIADAFDACVGRGARSIVVHPYFLAPGRHSTEDIPRIVADAAAEHPEVPYTITEPLGLDPRIVDVVLHRIAQTQSLETAGR